jgi:hypothetical protein
MQILRHSQIAVTMEIYNEVASDSSLRALMALGERLAPALLYFAAVLSGVVVVRASRRG